MYNQSMTYYPYEGSSPSEFIGIPRSYVGLVGRATYDYKTKYLLDLSLGYNGSENFAEGQRFGLSLLDHWDGLFQKRISFSQ